MDNEGYKEGPARSWSFKDTLLEDLALASNTIRNLVVEEDYLTMPHGQVNVLVVIVIDWHLLSMIK